MSDYDDYDYGRRVRAFSIAEGQLGDGATTDEILTLAAKIHNFFRTGEVA